VLECKTVSSAIILDRNWSQAARDMAKAANQSKLSREVRAKTLIGLYKPSVQLITWLALRKKWGDHNVILMKGGMSKSEHDATLAK
jgi:hypothetical protein